MGVCANLRFMILHQVSSLHDSVVNAMNVAACLFSAMVSAVLLGDSHSRIHFLLSFIPCGNGIAANSARSGVPSNFTLRASAEAEAEGGVSIMVSA